MPGVSWLHGCCWQCCDLLQLRRQQPLPSTTHASRFHWRLLPPIAFLSSISPLNPAVFAFGTFGGLICTGFPPLHTHGK